MAPEARAERGGPRAGHRRRRRTAEGGEVAAAPHAHHAEQRLLLLLPVAPGQQTAMDARMQGLDPSIHHFRKTGVVGNITYRNLGLFQVATRTTRTEDFDSLRYQDLHKFNEPRFITNTDQGTFYGS